MSQLRQIGASVLNLLFPPHCVSCGQWGGFFCATCRAAVSRVAGPVCALCGRPNESSPFSHCPTCLQSPLAIDGIRSVAFFEGPLREAIHAFKYEGMWALGEPLGELLAEGWHAIRPPGEILIPVPLHYRRMRERGYNQSVLLAQALSRRVGLPMSAKALRRERDTLPQVGLDVEQRRANVEGAFIGNSSEIRGREVLLIDDVCTTGATLSACAAALRPYRPQTIWALTLARAH